MIKNSEGNTVITVLSEEELSERLIHCKNTVMFMTPEELTNGVTSYLGDSVLIIKGEHIIPKPTGWILTSENSMEEKPFDPWKTTSLTLADIQAGDHSLSLDQLQRKYGFSKGTDLYQLIQKNQLKETIKTRNIPFWYCKEPHYGTPNDY